MGNAPSRRSILFVLLTILSICPAIILEAREPSKNPFGDENAFRFDPETAKPCGDRRILYPKCPGIDETADKLRNELNGRVPSAIQLMRRFLGSRHPCVNDAANLAMAGFGDKYGLVLPETITETIRALTRELQALADSGDEKSIPVLVEFLGASESGPHKVARDGLVGIGRPAVLPAAQVVLNPEFYAKESLPAKMDTIRGALVVLYKLRDESSEVAPLFVQTVIDENAPPLMHNFALELLSFLGPLDQHSVEKLRSLWENKVKDVDNSRSCSAENSFIRKLSIVLSRSGDNEATRFVLKEIQECFQTSGRIDLQVILDSMSLGRCAAPILPDLCTLLRKEDYPYTSYIAVAIGATGSADCLLTLTDALKSSNPQVVAGAAKTLGRLGKLAGSAVQDLEEVLRSHWSPSVLDETQNALTRISTNEPPLDVGYDWISHLRHERFLESFAVLHAYSAGWDLRVDHGFAHCRGCSQAKNIAFRWKDSWWISVMKTGYVCPADRLPEGFPVNVDLSSNCLEVHEVENGWLIGATRRTFIHGERYLIGELRFVGRDGSQYKITDGVYHFIEEIKGGLVHFCYGRLNRLVKRPNGRWEAKAIIGLPGRQRAHFFADTGELILSFDECAFTLGEDMVLRSLPCRPACDAPKCSGESGETCCVSEIRGQGTN